MKKLVSVLSSLRLALVLFILIIGLSMAATFLTPSLSSNFFRSPLFLVPVGFFFLNLLLCTLRRIAGRKRASAPRRHGPDLIHITVLLLIVAGILSIFLTARAQAVLGEGEAFRLPSGIVIQAERAEALTYEDGRPKEWLTTVRVLKNGSLFRRQTIEVNKPLSLGAYKVYQNTFSRSADIVLSDGKRQEGTFHPGDRFSLEGNYFFIDSVIQEREGQKAVRMSVAEGGGKPRILILHPGETRKGLTLKSVSESWRTGLLVTHNPLFPFILGLLILFTVGLGITFYQKIGDLRK